MKMKILEIIWDVLKLILGGTNYDMAVYEVSSRHDVSQEMIIMNLEERGYYKGSVSIYR